MNVFEPVFMSDPDYDRIAKIVYASYPKACILMIDRIKNKTLRDRYEARRAEMDESNERLVYHGTKAKFIHSIAEGGFLAELNKTSAHGLGTYFARDFGYSRDYSDTDANGISNMFFCRILAGRMAKGIPSKPVPKGADSFVDDMKNPGIYVIPEDARTLPEFLVRFHKTA